MFSLFANKKALRQCARAKIVQLLTFVLRKEMLVVFNLHVDLKNMVIPNIRSRKFMRQKESTRSIRTEK